MYDIKNMIHAGGEISADLLADIINYGINFLPMKLSSGVSPSVIMRPAVVVKINV